MPTYDYQCRTCDRVIEVIHPMTASGPSVCDACGGDLRRVLYPAGIIFKGSGFYRTDSRAGSDSGGSSSPAADAKGGATKGKEPPASASASESSSAGSATPSTGSGPKASGGAD